MEGDPWRDNVYQSCLYRCQQGLHILFLDSVNLMNNYSCLHSMFYLMTLCVKERLSFPPRIRKDWLALWSRLWYLVSIDAPLPMFWTKCANKALSGRAYLAVATQNGIYLAYRSDPTGKSRPVVVRMCSSLITVLFMLWYQYSIHTGTRSEQDYHHGCPSSIWSPTRPEQRVNSFVFTTDLCRRRAK